MIGNRPKQQDEQLPEIEVKHHEKRTEIRYNFTIHLDEDLNESYDYNYIKVYEFTPDSVKSALSANGLSDTEINLIVNKINF